MSDGKKKHKEKEHKKKKSHKKSKVKDKVESEGKENGLKKLTSDEILEALFDDVKKCPEAVDITNLINTEKSEELQKSEKAKSSKKKKKSKDKDKDRHEASHSDSEIVEKEEKKKNKHRKSSAEKKAKKHRKRRRSDDSDVGHHKGRSRTRSFTQSRSRSRSTSSPERKRDRRRSSSSISTYRRSDRSLSRDTYEEYDRSRYQCTSFRNERRPIRGRGRNNFCRNRSPGYNRFHRTTLPFRHRGGGRFSRFEESDYTNEYGKIDKQKLLEIATKNMTRLAVEGKLPKGVEINETMKHKSIDQLVDLCKKLTEDDDRLEKISSDENDYDEKYERWRSEKLKHDDDFVTRPVRPHSEIKINISNANSLKPKTPYERIAEEDKLKDAFPVSSGTNHRNNSEWVPLEKVEPTSIVPLTTALSKIKTNIPAAYKPTTSVSTLDILNKPAKVMDLRATFGTATSSNSTMPLNIKLPPPPPSPPKLEEMMSMDDVNETMSQTAVSEALKQDTLVLPPPPQPPLLASFDKPRHYSLEEVRAAEEAQKKATATNKATCPTVNNGTFAAPLPPPPPPLQPPVSRADQSHSICNELTSVGPHSLSVSSTPPSLSSHSSDYYATGSGNSGFVSLNQSANSSIMQLSICAPPTRSVQELIADRLVYSNRLKENPNDFHARGKIADIDAEMSKWAQSGGSSCADGKFSGSTGVRVLSADELGPRNPRFNAWTKKDIFKSAPEVNSGVGMRLLQKMGWQPGEGLGKDGAGPTEPLTLDVKADRKGLQATEEKVSRRECVVDATGKNPVSVVMEYCSKNRRSPPSFTCEEVGPITNRRFLWKAVLDGVLYEPSLPSTNKKAGKAQVCLVILEALGISTT